MHRAGLALGCEGNTVAQALQFVEGASTWLSRTTWRRSSRACLSGRSRPARPSCRLSVLAERYAAPPEIQIRL